MALHERNQLKDGPVSMDCLVDGSVPTVCWEERGRGRAGIRMMITASALIG